MKKEKRTPPSISKECPPADVAIWDCHVLDYGDMVDGWRINRFLAQGGFGAVYQAVDCRDSRRMAAVKIFTGDVANNDAHGKERIKLEAEILKKLNGEGSPVLFSHGDYKGRPYLVREYLQAIEPDEGDLPTERDAIKAFLKDTIESLKELHKIGWVHCDVKPANIARRLDSGKYVLIDFGSAHEIERDDDHQPRDNTMNVRSGEYVRIETRGYAPPELCFQPCRDIYAIGHVIRDCFKQEVPIEWSHVINKCISNHKEFRYPDIDSLYADIDEIDKVREEIYRELRIDKIKEQRATESSLLKSERVQVKWDDIRERDEERSGPGITVWKVMLESEPRKRFVVDEPWELEGNTILLILGPGILEANISGPDSSVVVLRRYAVVHNKSRVLPPDNDLTYVVVGPGSYLNFPNIDDADRGKFLPQRKRIFRDIDATTAFRLRGPDTFTDIGQQTLDAIRLCNMPHSYKQTLIDFFGGKEFTVQPPTITRGRI